CAFELFCKLLDSHSFSPRLPHSKRIPEGQRHPVLTVRVLGAPGCADLCPRRGGSSRCFRPMSAFGRNLPRIPARIGRKVKNVTLCDKYARLRPEADGDPTIVFLPSRQRSRLEYEEPFPEC